MLRILTLLFVKPTAGFHCCSNKTAQSHITATKIQVRILQHFLTGPPLIA